MVRATLRIRSCARADSPSRRAARASTSRAGRVEPAGPPQRAAPQPCVREAAVRLAPAGLPDPGGHLGRTLALPGPRELLAGDGGDVDVQVDAVQDGAGDAAPVAKQLLVPAQAGAAGVAQEAARARVHGGDQLELGRVVDGAARPGEDHVPLLERLAQGLEDVAPELGQLVEEEHAAVGERDLSGARRGGPAHQAGVRDGVVRRAEGALDEEPPLPEQAGHAVDRGGLERLVTAERREQARQAAGQHGLAAPRGAEEEQVVVAGGGDLERPLGARLPGHVPQVERPAGKLELPLRAGKRAELARVRPPRRRARRGGGPGGRRAPPPPRPRGRSPPAPSGLAHRPGARPRPWAGPRAPAAPLRRGRARRRGAAPRAGAQG